MSLPEAFSGVFLIDKPCGPSSFWVVRQVRRLLGIKKVGHAGTLDPFASGLLIVCAGRPATREISRFVDGEKEYLASLCLGVQTETLDPEGAVVERRDVGQISGARIEQCLDRFRGQQLQVPPAFSAVKHQGKPLYYYARKGVTITKEAREITISTLERSDGQGDIAGEEASLDIRVVCSKGTYIRTLAADIGDELGCVAHLRSLRRTRIGPCSITTAVDGHLLTAEDGLDHLLGAMLSVEEFGKLLQ